MLSSFLRLLLPQSCPACGRQMGQQAGICSACLGQLSVKVEQFSPLCSQSKPHLLSLGRHTGKVRRVVQAYKYRAARDLAGPLAHRLVHALPATWNIVGTTAVPLHPRRQRERGFNQSELLARAIAGHLNVPYLPLLRRTRYTAQQALQQGQQRHSNVRGAFEVDPACPYPHGTLLLVDDVMTTGATLLECAEALRDVGILDLRYAVLAR